MRRRPAQGPRPEARAKRSRSTLFPYTTLFRSTFLREAATNNPRERSFRAGDVSVKGDPARRPVRREHFPNHVLPRHGAPDARVTGRAAVVAHHEVLAFGHRPRAEVAVFHSPVGSKVRLDELVSVDVDPAPRLVLDRLAR